LQNIKVKLFLIFFLFSFGLLHAQDNGADNNFTGEVKADFVNNYYWRGSYAYLTCPPKMLPHNM